jgi:Tfp pilus assembly protein PilN
MRAVNLLPREQRRARLEGNRTPLLVAVGGLLLVTLGALGLGHSASSSASAKRAELATVRARIARLPKAEATTVTSGEIAKQRSERMAALTVAIGSRFALDRVLRQIAQVLPEDAWLTSLDTSAPGAGAATSGTSSTSGSTPAASAASAAQGTVSIEGATYTEEAVARVLARLALVPALEGVRLTASAFVTPSTATGSPAQGGQASSRKQGKKIVTFTVEATLRAGASR